MNAAAAPEAKEASMAATTSTARVVCDCGCGEVVDLALGSFDSTRATLAACSVRREEGIATIEIRKSAALALRSDPALSPMRHASALVVLA